MSSQTSAKNGRFEIGKRLHWPDLDDLSVPALRSLLKIDFAPKDMTRMRELGQKAQRGGLSEAEKHEIDQFELIGTFLGILQSKARRALRQKAINTDK